MPCLCAIGIYSLINHTLSSFRGRAKANLTQPCAITVIKRLKEVLDPPVIVKTNQDPFNTLIITIISQNTADTNTTRAFKNLSKQFKISPETFALAPLSEIEKCLRIGGLYKSKAQTIQTASKILLEKFAGNMKPILALPMEQARATLMEIPGVGPKTADVVLLFSANQPTIPVDTHVNRVSKRLCWAPQNGNYEIVRSSLQEKFEPKDYLTVHLLLISLGRKYCKAQRPLCSECPVKNYCPSNNVGVST